MCFDVQGPAVTHGSLSWFHGHILPVVVTQSFWGCPCSRGLPWVWGRLEWPRWPYVSGILWVTWHGNFTIADFIELECKERSKKWVVRVTLTCNILTHLETPSTWGSLRGFLPRQPHFLPCTGRRPHLPPVCSGSSGCHRPVSLSVNLSSCSAHCYGDRNQCAHSSSRYWPPRGQSYSGL